MLTPQIIRTLNRSTRAWNAPAAAFFVIIAAFGVAFRSVPLPGLSALNAATYLLPVLGAIASVAVLRATWRYSTGHRTTLVLMLTFAGTAALMLLQALTFPLSSYGGPILLAGAQAPVWFGIFWHATAAIGAMIYVAYRSHPGRAITSRRFALRATGITIAVVAVCCVVVLNFSDRLPTLFDGVALSGYRSSGIGAALFLLCACAVAVVFRIKAATALDRALCLSLLALTLDVGLTAVSGGRFTGSWYASRVLLTIGSWLVYIAAVRTLVASLAQLGQTEAELSRVETRSTKYADRIVAVWRIASSESSSEGDRFAAILDVATQALRPGRPMFGYLTRLEESTIVVEAVSWSGGDGASTEVFESAIYPGARFALESTTQSLVYAARCTQAWDDLDSINNEDMVFRGMGWRSIICAPLQIGRTTYFITFASPQTMSDEPFGEDDIAYVDVVSSFFTHRFSQQQQFERIQFQMEHDALTGLLNRVQFRKAVRAEISGGAPFAVAIVDLDGFRHINEAEGHQVADELLVEVAATLRSISDANTVARLSSDEFVVLIRDVANCDIARAHLKAYSAIFRNPFNTGDRDGTRTLMIGASIGAAHFPEHGATVEDLMRCADMAMGTAKDRGGSAVAVFDHAAASRLESARIRTVELADAIAHDQLALMYQPTFDLATRSIIGAEALVRWDHPQRGRLAPSEFVPLAERTRLVGPLSRWVLRRMIRDMSSWKGLPAQFRCYMNLAPQQLGDVEFIAELEEVLATVPGLRRNVGIEITETAVMQNVEQSLQTIDLFRDWGLRVAIDDFGTGYSSLSYLKRLPVDMIKIDRSFVSGLPDDDKDASLVDLLLRMSEGFGLTTLAEGIETEAQASWLLAHGCKYGQGYLVDQPLAFDHFVERVATTRPTLPVVHNFGGDDDVSRWLPPASAVLSAGRGGPSSGSESSG